jgi:hypothetical protein
VILQVIAFLRRSDVHVKILYSWPVDVLIRNLALDMILDVWTSFAGGVVLNIGWMKNSVAPLRVILSFLCAATVGQLYYPACETLLTV